MKYFTLFICIVLGFSSTKITAQNPVEWHFSIETIDDSTAYFVASAKIAKGWTVFGHYPYLNEKMEKDSIPTIRVRKEAIVNDCNPNTGPTCLEIVIEQGYENQLDRMFSTQKEIRAFSNIFQVNVVKYEDKIELKQKFKKVANQEIKGYVSFMTCNAEKCMPPIDIEFDITISE